VILRENAFFARTAEDILEAKRGNKMGYFGRCWNKKIHTNATVKHRRNTIANLKSENGTIISSHSGKEQLM
jgi:hypothetical protein